MFLNVIFVFMLISVSAKSYNQLDTSFTTPYLQLKNDVISAKDYLEKRLLHSERNTTDPEARVHFAFGLVARVVSELTAAVRPQNPPQRYEPLKVLQACLTTARDDYNEIANETNNFITEALLKVEPVIKIIDNKCHDTINTDICNKNVEYFINTSDEDIKNRAKLLLQLAKASEHVNGYSNRFDVITGENKQIQYLRHHVQDASVTRIMKEFANTYSLLKSM